MHDVLLLQFAVYGIDKTTIKNKRAFRKCSLQFVLELCTTLGPKQLNTLVWHHYIYVLPTRTIFNGIVHRVTITTILLYLQSRTVLCWTKVFETRLNYYWCHDMTSCSFSKDTTNGLGWDVAPLGFKYSKREWGNPTPTATVPPT